MNDHNKLNLNEFFYNLKDEVYIVAKLSENFPDYHAGDDIDIFCYSLKKVATQILGLGNKLTKKGYIVKVTKRLNQYYIDFYFNDSLEFRFDLYQKFPEYKKINIKEALFYSIIENATSVTHYHKGNPYPLFIPSQIDDLLLRYIEYIEWYETRPDKIKHADYISKKIKSDETRINILDKLHAYTDIPEFNYERKPSKFSKRYLFRSIRFRIKSVLKSILHVLPHEIQKALIAFYKFLLKVKKR